MFKHETTIRVRYAETDQMGVVYYGNYPQYYDVGRVEAIRSLGMSYKQLEEQGIMMPVTKMNIKYVLPAKYDELLTLVTFITEKPEKRIHFRTEIYNEQKDLLNFGEVSLAFVDMHTRKAVNIPEYLADKLFPFFKEVEEN
jgi:acyl-CoA thioester hydrolase